MTPTIEEIVAKYEPQVAAALQEMFASVLATASTAKIEAYIRAGDLNGLQAYVTSLYVDAAPGFLLILTETVTAAGIAAEEDIDRAAEQARRAQAAGNRNALIPTTALPRLDADVPAGVLMTGYEAAGGFRYNPVNPQTVAATRTWQGNLIQQMAMAQREAVMAIVREGVIAGQNPRTTARKVREGLTLTQSQTRHVAAFGEDIDRIIADGIRSAQTWGLYTPDQIAALKRDNPRAYRDLNFTATEEKVGRKWGKISRASGTLASDGRTPKPVKPIGFVAPPTTQGGENAFRIDSEGRPIDRMTSWRLRDKTLDPLIYDIVAAEERLTKARATGGAVKIAQAQAKLDAAKAALGARAQEVKDRYLARYVKHRSMVIARTETLRAANLGQYESWRQAVQASVVPESAMKRKWRTAGDDRVRLDHRGASGQEVGMQQPFIVGGESVMFPPHQPNCRCTVTYRVDLNAV